MEYQNSLLKSMHIYYLVIWIMHGCLSHSLHNILMISILRKLLSWLFIYVENYGFYMFEIYLLFLNYHIYRHVYISY